MKNLRFAMMASTGLMFFAPQLHPQEKSTPDTRPPSAVLKLQVTIGEQEGEKKLGNFAIVAVPPRR